MGEPRKWCLVLDTVSPEAASQLGDALADEGNDVDVESSNARVWCFAEDEQQLRPLEGRVMRAVGEQQPLQLPPMVRVWSETHHRYVDPSAPDEDPDTREIWIDSDLAPREIRWRVRLELQSVFEFRRVRRQLPALRRPVIRTGNRTIDLGARDFDDAERLAGQAAKLDGVAASDVHEIRSRLQRWLIRQRVAGNYAVASDGSGPGYEYSHHFGWGDGGGGGNGGGGHGGGHGAGGTANVPRLADHGREARLRDPLGANGAPPKYRLAPYRYNLSSVYVDAVPRYGIFVRTLRGLVRLTGPR